MLSVSVLLNGAPARVDGRDGESLLGARDQVAEERVRTAGPVGLIARVRRGEALPPLVRSGGVGTRMARYAGEEATLGRQAFIDDMERPGMLHGALVLSPHPPLGSGADDRFSLDLGVRRRDPPLSYPKIAPTPP